MARGGCSDSWRNLRNELDRVHLITLATSEGQAAQRTELTHRQHQILAALKLPEPPRFHDFTPTTTAESPQPAVDTWAAPTRHQNTLLKAGF